MLFSKEKVVYTAREIFIVSIGVLFAFFISNLSKSIGEKKKEKMILQDLLEDLRYNIDETEWSINYANELLNSCSNTIRLLKTNDFNIDSIRYALPALTQEVVTQISSTTYESIKNVGELNLIRNKKIRRLIVEYYTTSVKDVRRAESSFSIAAVDARRFVNNNIDVRNIGNHPKEILNSKKFYNIFHSAWNYTTFRQMYYNELLERSISLKEEINRYQETL